MPHPSESNPPDPSHGAQQRAATPVPATPIVEVLHNQALIKRQVCIQGWVKSVRHSKNNFSFVWVNDGTCLSGLQAVLPEAVFASADQLTTGVAISVEGQLVPSQGKGQAVEIQVSRLDLIGHLSHPEAYPIAKKRHSFEYLRTVGHLRTRTNTFGALTRLRHRVAQCVHQFFDQRHFYWVNTPIITASDCEGAGELFRVSTLDWLNLPLQKDGAVDFTQDFFHEPTYLTVSGQLQAEAYCQAFSRVYTFGPTFRAENSNTRRHLAEFWMIEPEVAFADLDDNIRLATDFLKFICTSVLEQCADDMAFFAEHIESNAISRLEHLLASDFERIEYSEAIAILERSGESFEFPIAWGQDLQAEHERYLTEQHVGRPVIVTNYPKEIKAFYMRENDDGKTVAAMDVLLAGIGEIVGGGQREERLDQLSVKLKALGLETTLDWYADLRRYGTTPHAGFGLGFERLLTYLTGMTNIRDVIPFPRTPGHAKF